MCYIFVLYLLYNIFNTIIYNMLYNIGNRINNIIHKYKDIYCLFIYYDINIMFIYYTFIYTL